MTELDELAEFLTPNSRLDLKVVAVEHVVGLTGSVEGCRSLAASSAICANLLLLLADRAEAVRKDASLALINMSADAEVVRTLMLSPHMLHLVNTLYDNIQDPDSKIAETATMILSNLTREEVSCSQVADALGNMEQLVHILCQEGYNKHGANLRYLGPLLSNLSQLPHVRKTLLDKDKSIIQRLLPFTQYQGSNLKKGGVVGTLRNCCFQTEYHDWLISAEVDIIPWLLLPLAGPTPDTFTEEEIDQLPVELQYLGEDKRIEEDPDIRKMLLEALTQLCAKRVGRESLRAKNAYIILRELHLQEKNREVALAAENIIDILIKTEEEINLENYKDVEVPDELVDKLNKMDEIYLQD